MGPKNILVIDFNLQTFVLIQHVSSFNNDSAVDLSNSVSKVQSFLLVILMDWKL